MAKTKIVITVEGDAVTVERVATPVINESPAESHTGYEYDYETNEYRFFE